VTGVTPVQCDLTARGGLMMSHQLGVEHVKIIGNDLSDAICDQ
jgi:hypothetical protein